MHKVRRLCGEFTQRIHMWWERSALNWAKSLYTWALVFCSAWIVWYVVSEASLFLKPDTPTLVQLDLLQAMAFLVAWSAFLMTVTVKAINANRDIQLANAEVGWKADAIRQNMEYLESTAWKFNDHIREHPDIEGAVHEMETRMGGLVTELIDEKDALAAENKRLRQKLLDLGIPD